MPFDVFGVLVKLISQFLAQIVYFQPQLGKSSELFEVTFRAPFELIMVCLQLRMASFQCSQTVSGLFAHESEWLNQLNNFLPQCGHELLVRACVLHRFHEGTDYFGGFLDY